jgi:hypothetical protein
VVEIVVGLYSCEVEWNGGGYFWHIILYLKFVGGLGVVDVVDGL